MYDDPSWDYEDEEEPAETAPPLSDQKKNALLRYMAILFGVAFLLVLLSFLIQLRDSRETISDLNQTNASALQNAGRLQDENQRLQRENGELRDNVESLRRELTQSQDDTARAEEAHREALTEKETLQKDMVAQTRARSVLYDAAQAWLTGDRARCESLLDRLEQDLLDEGGRELSDQLRAALEADTLENPDGDEYVEEPEEAGAAEAGAESEDGGDAA